MTTDEQPKDEHADTAPEANGCESDSAIRGTHRIGPVAGRVQAGEDEPRATTGERPRVHIYGVEPAPALPRRQSTRGGASEPESAVPLITHPRLLAELDLAVATAEHRLSLVNEQLNRNGVYTSSARRLRSERDQLHEEIHQRRVLRALALRGRL